MSKMTVSTSEAVIFIGIVDRRDIIHRLSHGFFSGVDVEPGGRSHIGVTKNAGYTTPICHTHSLDNSGGIWYIQIAVRR